MVESCWSYLTFRESLHTTFTVGFMAAVISWIGFPSNIVHTIMIMTSLKNFIIRDSFYFHIVFQSKQSLPLSLIDPEIQSWQVDISGNKIKIRCIIIKLLSSINWLALLANPGEITYLFINNFKAVSCQSELGFLWISERSMLAVTQQTFNSCHYTISTTMPNPIQVPKFLCVCVLS